MKQNRKISPKNQTLSYLTSGPGKLCQAFGFNLNHNQWNLTKKKSYPSIYVLDAKSVSTQKNLQDSSYRHSKYRTGSLLAFKILYQK